MTTATNWPYRELLELAAKAAGVNAVYEFTYLDGKTRSGPCPHGLWNRDRGGYWNPLTDDGDVLRLAVKLGLHISIDHNESTRILDEFEGVILVHMHFDCGPEAATRRAIVRAAASIGESIKGNGNG